MTAQILVDYLGCTLPADVDRETLMRLLGGNELWSPLRKPRNSYTGGLLLGGVTVQFGGNPDMGVHVEASGAGCRELEARGWNLFGLLTQLRRMGGRLCRLDVAVDDTDAIIPFEELISALKNGHYTSRSRGWEVIESGTREGTQGRTLYIGAKGSDRRLRIYERIRGDQMSSRVLRVELQQRDEAAEKLFDALLAHGDTAVRRVLRGFVEFKVPGKHSQRERWEAATWWIEFLNSEQRLPRQPEAGEKTVERSLRWFNRQVLPTLAMLWISAPDQDAFLREAVEEGIARLGEEHARAVSLFFADPQMVNIFTTVAQE